LFLVEEKVSSELHLRGEAQALTTSIVFDVMSRTMESCQFFLF